MRIAVFGFIATLSVLLMVSNVFAGTVFEVESNIIQNPSAEAMVEGGAENWGKYVGNGTFEMGVTDEEAHSGEYSCYLTVIAADNNNDLNGSILAGDSNGYDTLKAYECEDNTKYYYAFYAKAEDERDFSTTLRVLLWCWKAGGASGDRVFPAAARITLKSEWTRYEGTFTTPADAKTFALGIGVQGNKAADPEATFYLDDVYIGLTPAPADPGQAVDFAGKLAAAWGEIKSVR